MTVSTVRSQEKTASARHPLAPLTVAEAGTAARLALDASGPGSRLVYCALAEPAKEAVRGWDGGGHASICPERTLRTPARPVCVESARLKLPVQQDGGLYSQANKNEHIEAECVRSKCLV